MMWSHGPWGLAMWIGMLAFWAVAIWVVVNLTHIRGTPARTQRPAPETILAERFARGDVDAAEYHARIAGLRRHPTSRKRPDRNREHRD
jgi:putative membrane protein